MPPLEKKYTWTYEDVLRLGEEVRCEILKGDLMMTPSPDINHQIVSRNLEFRLWNYVQSKDLGEILDAPTDVVLDSQNVVQPDIFFVSKKNLSILEKRAVMGAPDLVIEILSQSSLHRDCYQKKELYQKFAIPEYWIVDPHRRSVEVFALENGVYALFCLAVEDDKAKSKILEGFEIQVSEIMPL